MKNYHKTILLLSLIILFTNLTYAYDFHEPIMIKDINATPANPYIIEGYEISNPNGDCINILNSQNIIIRNNYLHNCGTDKEFQKRTDHYSEGYATLIGNSSNITFENNVLDNSFRGFMAYNTPNLLATNNNITNTLQYSSLYCERCSDSEFSFNYLADNGNPMHFWVPSDRSIGIWIQRSDNLKIHDNIVIRSTSDGIAVTGHIYLPSFTAEEDKTKPHPQADWSGLSNNVEIYNNLILDNMEQGIWLVNARGIKVFNNTIRTSCFTYGVPISTEFNVGDSEFYNNKFLGCLNKGVGGANSFNISVYDNLFYSFEGRGDRKFASFSDNFLGVGDLANRQEGGAIVPRSIGNKERNNTEILISGKLAEEMKEKIKYAERFKTYEAKGWMACEREDGTLDEVCVKKVKEEVEQGVPKEHLFYSSLMEDFDLFVNEGLLDSIYSLFSEKELKEREIETEIFRKEKKTGITYVIEQLIESWEATLIGFFVICGIIVALVYKIRKTNIHNE